LQVRVLPGVPNYVLTFRFGAICWRYEIGEKPFKLTSKMLRKSSADRATSPAILTPESTQMIGTETGYWFVIKELPDGTVNFEFYRFENKVDQGIAQSMKEMILLFDKLDASAALPLQ
jgi:hypothetical protein